MRLWIVFTCFWGAVVAYLTVSDWPVPREWDHVEVVPRLSSESLRLIRDSRVVGDLEVDAKEVGGNKQTSVYLELPSGTKLVLPDYASETQIAIVRSEYSAALNQVVTQKRQQAALTGLVFWAVPCLALFACGWAARWVYRGFSPH